MKLRIFSFLFVFVFLFSLFASGGPLVEKMDQPPPTFKEFIDGRNLERKQKYETEDFDGLISLLGEAPVITKGNGEVIEGRDKIRDFFKLAKDAGWAEVNFRRSNAIEVPHVFVDHLGNRYQAIGIEISTFKFKKNPESRKGILTSRGRHKEACPWD